MRPNLRHQIQQYFSHAIRSKGAGQLHSPFVFSLYNQVLRKKSIPDPELENLRRKLRRSTQPIRQIDFKRATQWTTTLGKLARTSPTPARFSLFLRRLIVFLKASTLLETGTSLGLNTLYLSRTAGVCQVRTIEGNEAIANIAEKHFLALGTEKIELIRGELKNVFASTIQSLPEFIFLDADHSKEGTLRCIAAIQKASEPPKCIVIHDIHASKSMTRAWQTIIDNNAFPLTIDLYHAGLIFPKVAMEKQHFRLRM